MIRICLLISYIVLTAAEVSSGEYCDIDSKTCGNDKKLIFYDVNPPEGFNLRRDVYMRFAIMMSEAQKRGKDWELVLPPWYNLFHWSMDWRAPKQYFWNKFFDIDSLKSFAPVVEMYEVFSRTKSKVLELDTLYVLENFDDAFENGVFEEKWEIVGDCQYNTKFWGYNNITVKEILCVQFQGKVSKLWELISLHTNDKKVMFAHGEIPLHDTYGTKTYWDCRKSMKFKKELVTIAENYISKELDCNTRKCDNYLSVHWRRQDFARGRGDDVPTISGTVKQIHKALKKLPDIKKVFIATDASISEIGKLKMELSNLTYEVYVFLADETVLGEYKDGGMAILDQIICSHAAYFLGTHESTFTYRIQEEREILGFNSDTTFNRLCPDTGPCEKPSIWTIVD